MAEEVEVLIVGAGPTGLALACDLARRGVRFRIVDKAREYFTGLKAKGLQPRSLEVMDEFGIIGQVLSLRSVNGNSREIPQESELSNRA
jgi:2-polyprenyl-6-methoxyphenol hydroxylase-like FAD-dependent oxidoreductase